MSWDVQDLTSCQGFNIFVILKIERCCVGLVLQPCKLSGIIVSTPYFPPRFVTRMQAGKRPNECYVKITAGKCWTASVKKKRKVCLTSTLISCIKENESSSGNFWMNKPRYKKFVKRRIVVLVSCRLGKVRLGEGKGFDGVGSSRVRSRISSYIMWLVDPVSLKHLKVK